MRKFTHTTSTQATASAAKLPMQEAAYQRIKQEIMSLNFAPGDYLNELTLCSQLGIGRTPVHIALRRLMHEGLVEIVPRKGSMVKPLSLDEILQLTEVRLCNEVLCARLAAVRATKEDIVAMTALLERSDSASARGDAAERLALGRQFHQLISKAACNSVLADILSTLYDRSLRYWVISMREPQRHVPVGREHWEILHAIQQRDPDAAAESARKHVESFLETITRRIA
ncbi:MAG: GntR family transcriptional regulator [Burkholderiaceae bacterium]